MNIIQTTEVFDSWFGSLKDRTAKARLQARIDRAEDGNWGACGPMGEGVSEMRIHTGLGYRVCFKQISVEILCCWQVETRLHNNRTSRQHSNLLVKLGVNNE